MRTLVAGKIAIGDAVVLLSALRAYKKQTGDPLDIFSTNRGVQVLSQTPDVFERLIVGKASEYQQLLNEQRYDSVLLFGEPEPFSALAKQHSIPNRIYITPYSGKLRFNVEHLSQPPRQTVLGEHLLQHLLTVLFPNQPVPSRKVLQSSPLKNLGIDLKTVEDMKKLLLTPSGPHMTICPTKSSMHDSTWPPAHFATLIEKLIVHQDGNIYLNGAPSDFDYCEQIIQQVPATLRHKIQTWRKKCLWSNSLRLPA